MQVFISWSGERSRLVAELLNEWLSNVMQHLKTWYSPEMDRGSVWFNDIFSALASSSAGIICLTSENLNNPWILFESGAIAKGVTSNRVYTLTIDLEPESIKPPLGQFNATKPTCADMWKLVESINNFSDKDALDREKLLRAFNAFWPEFETRFEEIISNTKSEAAPSPRRSTDEMLNEILDIVRGLARDSENTILQKELSFQILHLLQHSKYDRKHSGNPFITNSYYPYGMSDQSYVSSGKINPIFNVIVDHQKLLNRSMNIDKPEQQATEDEGTDKSRMRTDSDDQPENDKKEGE